MEIEHENLGTVNQNAVTIRTEKGSVCLYFSYETIVAVNNFVSENDWSTTTGKLLNKLQPCHATRVSHKEVLAETERRLKAIL